MRLKQIRESRSLSQAQLAKKLGVSQGYISQIETGEKEPTLRLLRQMATELGVSITQLLTEDDD